MILQIQLPRLKGTLETTGSNPNMKEFREFREDQRGEVVIPKAAEAELDPRSPEPWYPEYYPILQSMNLCPSLLHHLESPKFWEAGRVGGPLLSWIFSIP